MNNAVRTALATLVIFFGSNATLHATTTNVTKANNFPFCIPFFTCKVSPPAAPKPTVPNAPEIEASVAASGIALVAATTMMLRGRRRKQ